MVSILMATYNGERYIKEQLDSIFNQTVSQYKIFIYDDCSTDNTINILDEYVNKYPGKIEYYVRDNNTGSAAANFFDMMKKHKDEYIMLCDQDDVWLPNKIEKILNKLKLMEQEYGRKMPILVHSDLSVVDSNLNILDKSYIHRVNANYGKNKINNIVIQNTLTGASAMYNKALAELIIGEPQYMVMHDWWLMLIAATFGKVDYIKDSTIFYRQHEKNVIGSTNMRSLRYMIKRFFNKDNIVRAINETYIQASSFYNVYKEYLSTEQRKFFESYIEIPHLHKIGRLSRIIKLNTFKNGFLRNVAYILFV